MNNDIVLNYGLMKEAAKLMNDGATRFDDAKRKVDNLIESLGDDWQSTNKEKLNEKYRELNKIYPKFKEEMFAYSDRLNKIVSAYEEASKKISNA